MDFTCDEEDMSLSEEADLTLFRALQEGLSNVVRHSEGASVAVDLARQNGGVVLAVRDTGGTTSDQVADGRAEFGLGLAGMRERVSQFAGEVVFDREDGIGLLTVSIPTAERAR